MNRKKTIDYTVTRRPRERDSSKFRQDSSSREARGRDDGDSRSKTPFWSNNDKNLVSKQIRIEYSPLLTFEINH